MKTVVQRTLLAAMPVIVAALCVAPVVAQNTYLVTVDTSSVQGTSGFLDFQFNPGSGSSQPATAVISNFTTNGGGVTGAPPVSGSVSGMLPGTVTFMNSTALNEYFQGFNFGSNFSFTLTLSGPAITSPNGTSFTGTTFSMSLFDSSQNPILTNQSNGVAGQIDINLNGTTTATAFPTVAGGPSAVTFVVVTVAAQSTLDGPYQVKVFPNLLIGDAIINLTNTGANAAASGVFGFSGGNICVNVYTFDAPSEEMAQCCSCSLTPNQGVNISVRNLAANSLTGVSPTNVVVKLVATGGMCNPGAITPVSLVNGLVAFGTNIHGSTAVSGGLALTETRFIPSTLSAAELAHLTTNCAAIQTFGSGHGVCPTSGGGTCVLGVLGGVRM